MKLQFLFNGYSDDRKRVFASVKGHPEAPSIRLEADEFHAVYGRNVRKGDGFTVEVDQLQFIGEVFIPMRRNKPERDEKRHIVRFEDREDALEFIQDVPHSDILETYNYCIPAPDSKYTLVEGIREGDAHGEAVDVEKKRAAQLMGQ